MLTGIVCIVIYLLLIAPVRIRVDAWWHAGAQIDCWARLWGLPLGESLRIGDGAGGHVLFLAKNDGQQLPGAAVRRALANIGAVLRGDRVRRYLQRHVKILQMDACVRISMQDAAKTALLSGTAQQLARAVYALSGEKARIAVIPAFLDERSGAEVRCIVFFRLGHMIPVLLAGLAAWVLERREHRVPAGPALHEEKGHRGGSDTMKEA